jgi:outer membrane protein
MTYVSITDPYDCSTNAAYFVCHTEWTVHRRFHEILLASSLTVLYAQVSVAETEPCTARSADCAVVGRWELSASLGLGQRSNPIEGKSNIPLVVIPHISWYGKRFFLENLEVGYTLHDGESNQFNLIAAPGYDRVFFYRNDLQNIFIAGVQAGGASSTAVGVAVPATGREFEVKDRHTTYLVGPEWNFSYGRVTGQLNALREVTGQHDGYEARAALAAPLMAGRFGSLTAGAGLTWKSKEVVRYYYGVEGLYEPGSGLNPFVKLHYSLPLSDRWTINALAHYERLAGAIAESPIVTEDHVTTVFVGAVLRIH